MKDELIVETGSHSACISAASIDLERLSGQCAPGAALALDSRASPAAQRMDIIWSYADAQPS